MKQRRRGKKGEEVQLCPDVERLELGRPGRADSFLYGLDYQTLDLVATIGFSRPIGLWAHLIMLLKLFGKLKCALKRNE